MKINDYRRELLFSITNLSSDARIYIGKCFQLTRLENGVFLGQVCLPRAYPEELIDAIHTGAFDFAEHRSIFANVPLGPIIGKIYFRTTGRGEYLAQAIDISSDINVKYINLFRLFLRILGIDAISDGKGGTYLFNKAFKLKPGQQWSQKTDPVQRLLNFSPIPAPRPTLTIPVHRPDQMTAGIMLPDTNTNIWATTSTPNSLYATSTVLPNSSAT